MSLQANIENSFRDFFVQDLQSRIIETFRSYTPGYQYQHIVKGIPEHRHDWTEEHIGSSGPERFSQTLVDGWQIETNTGRSTIAVVVNTAPYASLNEYGWVSKGGTVVPGHYIVQSVLANEPWVFSSYIEVAQRALIVSLAGEFKLGSGPSSRGAKIKASVAAQKTQAGLYFTSTKRVRISGGRGSGITQEAFRELVMNFGEYVANKLNGD